MRYVQSINYVRSRNTRAEMYAGRVACCTMVSRDEYAPRALLRLEKKTVQTDRRTDGRTNRRTLNCYITLTANAASLMNINFRIYQGEEMKWTTDPLRRENNNIGYLSRMWRRAVGRGRSEATLRSLLTTR